MVKKKRKEKREHGTVAMSTVRRRWSSVLGSGGAKQEEKKKKKRKLKATSKPHKHTHTQIHTLMQARRTTAREEILKKKKKVMSALHVITCRLRPSDYHLSFSLSGMCVTPQHPFGDGGTRKKGKRAKKSLRTI